MAPTKSCQVHQKQISNTAIVLNPESGTYLKIWRQIFDTGGNTVLTILDKNFNLKNDLQRVLKFSQFYFLILWYFKTQNQGS